MKKLILTIFLIYTFFLGVCCSVVLLNSQSSESVQMVNQENTVFVEKQNEINSSIDKIFNAVFLVENIQNGKLFSTGTGFVYKNEDVGYMITNYHVVENADEIIIINSDKVKCNAEILGYDKYLDIAVLSLSSDMITLVANIGDSSNLKLGDTLFTVGSPLGIEYMGSVTKGILSGINRTVSVSTNNGNFLMDVIQTDAAINPGNSGGPLVDVNGNVIGVISMKLVKDEIEGMGFAIPIELVMSSIEQLENGENIERPYLGIELLDITNDYLLNYYHIDVNDKINNGIVIIEVEHNSIAEKYNLKKGDIITSIDNYKISDVAHFRYVLYKYKKGSNILLTYYRDGKENNINISL